MGEMKAILTSNGIKQMSLFNDFNSELALPETINFEKTSGVLIILDQHSMHEINRRRNNINKNNIFLYSSYYTNGVIDTVSYIKKNAKYHKKYTILKEMVLEMKSKKDFLSTLDKKSDEYLSLKKELNMLSEEYEAKKKKIYEKYDIKRLYERLPMPTSIISFFNLFKHFDITINKYDYSFIMIKSEFKKDIEATFDSIQVLDNEEFLEYFSKLKDEKFQNPNISLKFMHNVSLSEHGSAVLYSSAQLVGKFLESVEIPSLSSISLGDVQPVAELKTNIMASLVASGAISFNKTIKVNNEDVAVHQIMKKTSSSETAILNGENVTKTIYQWKNVMGQYNLLRKEFSIIEE